MTQQPTFIRPTKNSFKMGFRIAYYLSWKTLITITIVNDLMLFSHSFINKYSGLHNNNHLPSWFQKNQLSNSNKLGNRINNNKLCWNSCQAHDTNSRSTPSSLYSKTIDDEIEKKGLISELWIQKIKQKENNDELIQLDSLLEMDIVIFSRTDNQNDSASSNEPKFEIGAVQEDGTLAPLSAWTLESIYTTSDTLELLVDENDRTSPGHGGGFESDQIVIWKTLEENQIGYGSRQVGGGKGLGNPHGEESELLYYIEREALKFSLDLNGDENEDNEPRVIDIEVDVVLKPELEILW